MKGVLLPLKFTHENKDILTACERYITTNHGQNYWDKTKSAFQKLKDLHNSFDFEQDWLSIRQNYTKEALLERETNLIQYIRHVKVLDDYFSDCFKSG